MAKKFLFVLIAITGLLNAQMQMHLGPFRSVPGSSGKISWSPKEPKEGEIVTVTFEFTSSVDAAEVKVNCLADLDTKIIGPTCYKGSIKKGETKRFITKIKFYQKSGALFLTARVSDPNGVKFPSGKTHYWGDLAICQFHLIFDDSTKTFVGQSEYLKRRTPKKPPLPPEYTYDIIAGAHDLSGGVRPEAEAKKLRAQMDSLKQLDPTLTDEEALQMLHDIEVQMLVQYGIDRIDSKEKSVQILIKARKLMKEQGLSKWEAVDKVVEEEKEGRGSIFFRPNRGGDTGYSAGSDSTSRQKTDVTLTGTVQYKKHLTDKDQGLLTQTVDMALRFVKVYFWCY